ncbi:hypothetical protein QAD02_014403 [Eretmocerus hayati]|uniref:Uncharacterized protein n=1 Tax=Eretmocerus hayati TaxID=131215 RepID=A0ACC2P6G5_9HYME|nr:hypothetical protein QAD02_014403 [Eretmocerus hayati]
MESFKTMVSQSNVDNWCQTSIEVAECNYAWSIVNFSFCKEKPGEALESSVFWAPGHEGLKWRLMLYPSGNNQQNQEFVSVFLHLVASDQASLRVDFGFHLINASGRKFNERRTDPEEKWTFHQDRQSGFPRFASRRSLTNLLASCNDELRLRCRVRSSTGHLRREASPACSATRERVPGNFEGLSRDLARLLDDDQFRTSCDARLEAGRGESAVEVGAHRAVLACRSPVFEAMFGHEMIERREGVVRMPDLSPHVLRAMLRFVYTGELHLTHGNETERCHPAELLAAADKYAIEGLKEVCEKMLLEELDALPMLPSRNDNEWASKTLEWLALAERHQAPRLMRRALAQARGRLPRLLETTVFKNIAREQPHLVELILRSIAEP